MTERPLGPGDKFFAGFLALAYTVMGLVAIAALVSIEVAIWGAGVTNGLVWHIIVLAVAWISSFVYKVIIRKGDFL